MRFAWFDETQLTGAFFLASEPVAVARDFAASLLGKAWLTFSERAQVLASVPSADLPDKGKIICACMQVGQNEIARAIASRLPYSRRGGAAHHGGHELRLL